MDAPKDTPQWLGSSAELAAQNHLKKHGLTILQCNFACQLGEIDIIAQDGNCIVFVEVRYRKHSYFGGGAATVTRQKQKKIIRTAAYFLQRFRHDVDCRFDVIEVSPSPIPSACDNNIDSAQFKFDWIKAAFM